MLSRLGRSWALGVDRRRLANRNGYKKKLRAQSGLRISSKIVYPGFPFCPPGRSQSTPGMSAGCSEAHHRRSFLESRSNCWNSRLSCFAATEYRPCFQLARCERASPSAVRGPVLFPPCIRQRPFDIAGHSQRVPLRVLAPQRAAFEKLPEGLAFLSVPRRFSWGSLPDFACTPTLPPGSYIPDNRLPARLNNRHMLDQDFLTASGAFCP